MICNRVRINRANFSSLHSPDNEEVLENKISRKFPPVILYKFYVSCYLIKLERKAVIEILKNFLPLVIFKDKNLDEKRVPS